MKATSEELAIFVAVAESGSFSRAAKQLNLANSAVSRAVKKLEMKLGTGLLNRTTRQLSLTSEGARYFRRVKQVLQEMAAAENELIESRQTPRGLLRVDAATPVMLHLLMPMIKPFHDRYPETALTLVSSETFINLIDRKVDVAIRAGELTDSSLRARPLMTSYRKLVASPSYIAERGVPNSITALSAHQCLGFNEPAQLNRWPVATSDNQPLEIHPDITSNSGETIRHLCLNGNGLACLSDFMIDADIAAGRLVEVLSGAMLPVAMPVNAVYYSDGAVSIRIRAFIDFVSEWLVANSIDRSTNQLD